MMDTSGRGSRFAPARSDGREASPLLSCMPGTSHGRITSIPNEPQRRGQGRDNDIFVPRTENEARPADEGNLPRAAGSSFGPGLAPLTALFTPPVSAIGPLFRYRFERIHGCRIDYDLDINNRATMRVLGGYHKLRRLIRVYARDREQGVRPVEELFRHVSPRDGPPSRVHRALFVLCPVVWSRARPDA